MSQTTATGWNIANPEQLYKAAVSDSASYGTTLHLMRLAPGEGSLTADWIDFAEDAVPHREYSLEYRTRGGTDATVIPLGRGRGSGAATITGLTDGTDYELCILAEQAGSPEPERSPWRLFRPGHVPGTVINYIHPEDYTYGFSGRSVASPSIVRLPDGSLLASHDIFWGNEGQNTSMLFRSRDDGATWSFVQFLYPCFWGKLFLHRGRLYMLATSTEYGALLIGRSDDGGETWSAPTEIIAAGSQKAGGPHKAPMPVIEHNGRLWTGIDYGSWTLGSHASGLVSVPADADLLDSSQWTVMPFLPYDLEWPGTVGGTNRAGLLEGNAVVTPDGKLVNLLRYQTNGGNPDHGRAIMLQADPDRPEQPLTFYKVIPFYGNLSKFTVYYDLDSACYWSLVSRVKPDKTGQRNILALVRSADLEHWEIVQDVLNYEDNGWPEDFKKVGFQYIDWISDGDDILFASRTAINGAYNFHNANYLTYHKIANFRSL
ncbi:hypothetical protein ACFFNY_11090 [Paenibacillus hodogayensis]|uniref:Exo-alpha-sialidase n=1 Tax=Paenibacillus hodogayensis TaxID=279208 RepID=A0ABV5VUW9_9BACL